MKHRQDAAYILATTALGEADLIVTLLAEHAGRVRGVAPSARKSRRRFGGALEPMTLVDVRWTEREGRDLHRIDALDLNRSFAAMQAAPERQAACAVLSEIAFAVTREGEGDAREFRLLGAVLNALERGFDPWLSVRYFEYWTLRLLGVLPDLNACASCGVALNERAPAWLAAAAGLLCSNCRGSQEGSRRITRDDRALLAAIASLPPTDLGGYERPARPGGAVGGFLRGTIENFLERPLRTYRHLQALVP